MFTLQDVQAQIGTAFTTRLLTAIPTTKPIPTPCLEVHTIGTLYVTIEGDKCEVFDLQDYGDFFVPKVLVSEGYHEGSDLDAVIEAIKETDSMHESAWATD